LFHHYSAISRVLSPCACRSVLIFALGVQAKKDITKSQRGYISRIGREFPTQPNSTEIGTSVGVADIINHTKFRNDRLKEYKVTEF